MSVFTVDTDAVQAANGAAYATMERLQGESAERLQGLLADLHRRVEARDTTGASEYKDLLDSALTERDLLAKLPTWPWQGETVRLVGTAVVLPIVIFLIQQVLGRLLGL